MLKTLQVLFYILLFVKGFTQKNNVPLQYFFESTAYKDKITGDRTSTNTTNFFNSIRFDSVYAKNILVEKVNGKLKLFYTNKSDAKVSIDSIGKAHKYKAKWKRIYRRIVFPFIYLQRRIDKFIVQINDAGELVVTHKFINEGMIFIFGAGNSYNIQYFFKPIPQL